MALRQHLGATPALSVEHHDDWQALMRTLRRHVDDITARSAIDDERPLQESLRSAYCSGATRNGQTDEPDKEGYGSGAATGVAPRTGAGSQAQAGKRSQYIPGGAGFLKGQFRVRMDIAPDFNQARGHGLGRFADAGFGVIRQAVTM